VVEQGAAKSWRDGAGQYDGTPATVSRKAPTIHGLYNSSMRKMPWLLFARMAAAKSRKRGDALR